jgi:hypothetical protein
MTTALLLKPRQDYRVTVEYLARTTVLLMIRPLSGFRMNAYEASDVTVYKNSTNIDTELKNVKTPVG